MSGIDGEWDSVVRLPIGEQKARVVLGSHADGRLTGTYSGPTGSSDISEGQIVGTSVTFTVKFTSPVPVNVKVEAELSGDVMEGRAKAGVFGRFPLKATRRS